MELIFSLEEIGTAARQLLARAENHCVFAFHGEMGAGKTTFIHALCEALGVTDRVSSPTFSIINEYRSEGDNKIYHMDLYRMRDEAEAVSSGVADCLFSGSICLVEWPDKAPGIFPDDTIHIIIVATAANTRKLDAPGL